jgi:hypothetical protein
MIQGVTEPDWVMVFRTFPKKEPLLFFGKVLIVKELTYGPEIEFFG